MSARPERLILIHGAWAGAWVWEALVAALSRLGREALALDLPGDGIHPIAAEDVVLEDYFDALDAAIGAGPVALVGHSGGGMLVTAAAERFGGRVGHGIWVAGMLLKAGESFDDIQAQVAGPGQKIGVTPHILPSADGTSSTVPPAAALEHFFQDLEPKVAARAADRLTPQPTVGHRIPSVAGPAMDRLPKLYVQATQDRSVRPQAQRIMCAGWDKLDVTQMNTGHVPQVADPDGLAAIIDDWLSATSHIGA